MIYLKYEQWNIVAEACSAIHGCLNSLKTLFKYNLSVLLRNRLIEIYKNALLWSQFNIQFER